MGACDCNDGWTGQDCSMGPGTVQITASPSAVVESSTFTVHWARPTNDSEADADYIALFPIEQSADNLNDPISLDYANQGRTMLATINSIAQVGDVTLTAPDKVGRYIARYVRASHGDILGSTNVTVISSGCHNNCSGHGVCVDGICKCALGYTGDDCSDSNSESPCPSTALGTCNGHGECTKIRTRCEKYGVCLLGTCVCDGGWSGDDCSLNEPVELGKRAGRARVIKSGRAKKKKHAASRSNRLGANKRRFQVPS